MFGIGPQELIIIGIIFLLIFGPSKLSSTARDIGRFTTEARRSVDEFKSELTSVSEEVNETRRSVVDEVKSEIDLDSGKYDSKRPASTDAGRLPQVSPTEEQPDDEDQRT